MVAMNVDRRGITIEQGVELQLKPTDVCTDAPIGVVFTVQAVVRPRVMVAHAPSELAISKIAAVC